jgi:hypothetical protein
VDGQTKDERSERVLVAALLLWHVVRVGPRERLGKEHESEPSYEPGDCGLSGELQAFGVEIHEREREQYARGEGGGE